MKLDSARSFKMAEAERAGMARVEARLAALAEPPTVSLGIMAGKRRGDFHVAVRAAPGAEAEAEAIAARAAGEADVAIILPFAGPHPYAEAHAGTAPWLNEKRRPVEGGIAVSPSRPWVGTGTGLFRRKDGTLVFPSCNHVYGARDGVPKGTPVLQPFGGEPVALTAEDVPLVARHNLVDWQSADLRQVEVLLRYSHAVGTIRGAVRATAEDLGREAVRIGRSTGFRRGNLTAVELDDVAVGFGGGIGTLYFDQYLEYSGERFGLDFSAGGDSGSAIFWTDGFMHGHLSAGGKDNRGVDRTYAGQIMTAMTLQELTIA